MEIEDFEKKLHHCQQSINDLNHSFINIRTSCTSSNKLKRQLDKANRELTEYKEENKILKKQVAGLISEVDVLKKQLLNQSFSVGGSGGSSRGDEDFIILDESSRASMCTDSEFSMASSCYNYDDPMPTILDNVPLEYRQLLSSPDPLGWGNPSMFTMNQQDLSLSDYIGVWNVLNTGKDNTLKQKVLRSWSLMLQQGGPSTSIHSAPIYCPLEFGGWALRLCLYKDRATDQINLQVYMPVAQPDWSKQNFINQSNIDGTYDSKPPNFWSTHVTLCLKVGVELEWQDRKLLHMGNHLAPKALVEEKKIVLSPDGTQFQLMQISAAKMKSRILQGHKINHLVARLHIISSL